MCAAVPANEQHISIICRTAKPTCRIHGWITISYAKKERKKARSCVTRTGDLSIPVRAQHTCHPPQERTTYGREFDIVCTVHRISNVYISRPTKCTNSYNVSLFIIKHSTCFGLSSPSSGATFVEAVYRNWYTAPTNVVPDDGLESPKHVECLMINKDTLYEFVNLVGLLIYTWERISKGTDIEMNPALLIWR